MTTEQTRLADLINLLANTDAKCERLNMYSALADEDLQLAANHCGRADGFQSVRSCDESTHATWVQFEYLVGHSTALTCVTKYNEGRQTAIDQINAHRTQRGIPANNIK